ncbi:apolipoprotein D-like [Lytechinus pictus]|uniref:apolipoprotein D-like n=1 Tax=Lytechinus pictus TaxID=7653 RepID=UPI0030B9C16B
MTQASFAFLLAIVGFSSAQVFRPGPCPDVQPVDDFDVHRYAGRWYEIARFFNSAESGLKCQSQYYTVEDGYLLSKETGLGAHGQEGYSYESKMYNPTFDWKIGILYYAWPHRNKVIFRIPLVNYDRYSVNIICQEYFQGFANIEYAWVIARNRTMSEEDYSDIMRRLNSMGIDVKEFIMADQTNCPNYHDDNDDEDGRSLTPK